MKKSVVLGVLSKSPRFGRQTMVYLCSARNVVVNNNFAAAVARNLFQAHIRLYNPGAVVAPAKCFYSSGLSHRDDESDSDTECLSKDSDIDSEIEDSSLEHRRFLYPDSQDPIILKLNECASVQAIFDIVAQYESEFTAQHGAQALLILWDLQKMFYKVTKETQSTPGILINTLELLNNYAEKVVSHNDFMKIVNHIERGMTDLSPDAITCTFLYLRRMGIPFHKNLMQNLFLRIEELLNRGVSFPLSALSRYTVALRESKGLSFVCAVQNVLPYIYEKIDSCQNEMDLHLLSICILNVSSLMNADLFNTYKYQVEQFLASGVLATFDISVIVKVASVFNSPTWFHKHSEISRKLLLLLKGKTSNLKTFDLLKVHKMIERHLEPADLQSEISQHASHLLSEEESLTYIERESVELLQCVVSYCPPKEKKGFENLTFNFLKPKLNPHVILSLFKILRYLKTSNIELCDKFWSATLEVMRTFPEEYSSNNIGKYANRYMFFNNNLSGTYRNYAFETQIVEWYLDHYQKDIIRYLPSKFAQMIGFLVAYCDTQADDFFEKLMDMVTKLEAMSSQLSVENCIQISRGINLSSVLGYKVYSKPHMFNIYVRLNTVLNACIKRHIISLDDNISNINMVMQSYVLRKAPETTDIIQCLLGRYENYNGAINSKSLREASHNFLMSKCLIPKTVDDLTEYVIQNGAHMFGDTVALLLHLCFSLGYTPSNVSAFSKVASDVLLRESHRLSGMSVLQSCLTLCFFHCFPEELVHIVFTINFLERLDEEIADCYAKGTFPSRVRNLLMQLNRAVCLDYPEFDVPWFHKKYCEEIAATDLIQTSVFHGEVKETLIDILGGKPYVKIDSYIPYGYKLDFEIFLSKNKVPVSWKQRSDKDVYRKAVLLLRNDAFSNNVRSLNGYNKMKKRHLEMLGYEVIEVEESVWNSMYMTEPGMKPHFMQEKVFRNEKEKIGLH